MLEINSILCHIYDEKKYVVLFLISIFAVTRDEL